MNDPQVIAEGLKDALDKTLAVPEKILQSVHVPSSAEEKMVLFKGRARGMAREMTQFARHKLCLVCKLILSNKSKKLATTTTGFVVHKHCKARWENTVKRAALAAMEKHLKDRIIQECPATAEETFIASGTEPVNGEERG